MGQECCSQRKQEQSSIVLMNGVSYRKSIQEAKIRISHVYDEEIIENIREYKENKQRDNKDEQIDNLTKIPLFQIVNQEVNMPLVEQQIIKQEKIVENNYIIPEDERNQCEKEEQGLEIKRESIEKSNIANIKQIQFEQETVLSKQIENHYIDKILKENKLESEQLSFSTNFDTVTQQSQSNIEQSLKRKQIPGKLSQIFLRALERKILGIQDQKEERQEEMVTIMERPVPKVRPRKIQQLVEL